MSIGNTKLYAIFAMKCPRCMKSDLFSCKNPYNFNKMLAMPQSCPHCRQSFNPEIGFYWGALYISYMLAVLSSATTFLLYYLFFWDKFFKGEDNIHFFVGFNGLVLFLLCPLLTRLSRSFWINIAVGKNSSHTFN